MQELEKILEEIESHAIEFEVFGVSDDYISVGWVKDIIRKHMVGKDNNVHTNDGWISVEERMPEKEGKYLVTLRVGEKVTLLGYGNCRRDVLGKPIGFGWYDCATAVYFSEDAIIAWQPLPEPYRPERRKDES